jgi:hypothetical protein
MFIHSSSLRVLCFHGGRHYLDNSQLAAACYRAFLYSDHLFSDKHVGLQFLKDMGLLTSNMVCSVCGCHMSSCIGASVKGSFGWRSQRRTSASRYNGF